MLFPILRQQPSGLRTYLLERKFWLEVSQVRGFQQVSSGQEEQYRYPVYNVIYLISKYDHIRFPYTV